MSRPEKPESQAQTLSQAQPQPQLRRLLVPLDGSRLAEAALPAAFALAARCGAEVTLLHVIEHNAPSTVHGEPHLDEVDEAHAYLESVAARYQDTGVAIDLHVHPNQEHDVARSIGQHADELAADLIALATHGSSGLRGFLFGRIAQQVLRHTDTPVLLVQPVEEGGGEPPEFNCRVILVPLDDSVDSVAALPWARLLGQATGAQLRLVRVVATVGTVSGERGAAATFSPTATAALLNVEEQHAEEDLAALRRELSGLNVSMEVRRGEVPTEIERAAREASVDLIVMSTHGRAGLSGRLTGSVATRLLSRVACPLLLVRVDGAGAAAGE